MTYFQMECFLSLAQTRKLSTTAGAMGLSLSTLSKHIDKMEDELSARLFKKTQQQITLTREGELIFPSIEYIIKQYKEQCAALRKFSAENKTTATIALAFHQKQIIRRLISFMEAEPSIELIMTEVAAGDVDAMLSTGAAAIGVMYDQLSDKKYPESVLLRKDRVVAVVSEKHPLAGRSVISVKELQDEMFYLFKGDHLMYQYQLRTCISAGFAPQEEHSDMRVSTILKYVAADLGVSLLVENTVKTLAIGGVVTIGLEERPGLTLSAICPSIYPSEVQQKLLAFLGAEELQF